MPHFTWHTSSLNVCKFLEDEYPLQTQWYLYSNCILHITDCGSGLPTSNILEIICYPALQGLTNLSFFVSVDSKSIDINAKIPDEVLQQLKDFGLFGQQIPIEYGKWREWFPFIFVLSSCCENLWIRLKLLNCLKKKKNIVAFCIIPLHLANTGSWKSPNRQITTCLPFCQYHGCWWLGNTWNQGINRHGIVQSIVNNE